MPKLSQIAGRMWREVRELTGDVREIGKSVAAAVDRLESAQGTTETTDEVVPLNPDVRFEHSDIDARGTVITGYSVLIGTGIVVGLLYFFFSFLAHYRAASSPPPLAIAAHGTPVPPQPRIQSSPRRDMEEMRTFENSVLNKYWWVDQRKGVVGLPIDRAMDLIVQRGIPPQKAPEDLKLFPPQTGDRSVGFEGKVAPEPR